MTISQQTIAAVQSRVNIEEVVTDFITLKGKGQNLWACCPFHHEKTPSFSVAPTKGFYKCFGCGVSGDAITFVMEIEGISFPQAMKYLARKYGIVISEEENEESHQQQNEKESLYILMDIAQEYYTDILWKQKEGQSTGLSYLKARGYPPPLIEKFGLGYSHDTWDAFYQFAKQKGYSDALLEKSGLIIQKENKTYDRFRGRVTFPIHNLGGKVIAFGARILQSADSKPKYINSPETLVYQKSKALYGIYHAKKQLKQENNCYLVEGYTDVLAMHKAGIENVVASSGTSLTDDQIQLLSRFTKNIIVLFDGDTAGIKASLRGIDMILEKGLNVKTVLLPDKEDPDSFASKVGAQAFQDYLKTHRQDFITFKATILIRAIENDPIKKAEAIQEIVKSIAVVPDSIKRAVFTKECSQLFDIEEGVLIAAQNKWILQKNYESGKRRKARPTNAVGALTPEVDASQRRILADSIAVYEKESIRMLLSYGTNEIEKGKLLYEYLLRELEDVSFRTPECKEIWEQFKAQLNQGKAVDATYFIQHGSEAIKKLVIDLIAEPYEISKQWEKRHQIYVTKEEDILPQAVYKNILRLKLRLIQQLIEDNRAVLHNNTALEEEKLLKIHEALKKSEIEIAKQLSIVVTS